MLRRKDAICLPDNVGRNTGTHSGYLIFTAFYDNNGYVNTPHCCVICTLPILFMLVDG
jgi:hypothetical protein